MLPAIAGCHLFAASSWPFAVVLAVLPLAVLFVLAFTLARNSGQRLANLFFGLAGSILALCLSLGLIHEAFGIRPRLWDDYIPFVAPVAMTVGAGIGVLLSVLIRKCLSLLTHRLRH
jgi:hypothetical protein